MMGVFVFMLIFILQVNGERVHEQIYSSIEGTAPCFRRLNGTHQAGCTSSNKGAVGTIQMVNNVSDAQWLVYNGTGHSYMAVVSTSLFNTVIDLFMAYPQNVAGILVYENANDTPSFFSTESRCPNEYSSGPGSQCSSEAAGGVTWNEHGNGLMRRDVPFPIFYLPESHFDEITKINNCYMRFNLDKKKTEWRPLCSVQLYSFMFAAVNSEVCMRRPTKSDLLSAGKSCDPLGNFNVYSSLFPRSKESKTGNRTVTFVTARIDSASLFDGLSPGGASSVVGMVTLISSAAALAAMIPAADAAKYNHNILWTLLNGETFDYIGSQRVAYDIARGVWPPNAPIDPTQIKLHVELGQLGGALRMYSENISWPIHAFVPHSPAPEVTEFLNIMNKAIDKDKQIEVKFSENLPPSSLHSFRRILKNATASGQLAQLLLVDHENTFSNHYYQSALDDARNIMFTYRNVSIDSNGKFINTDELIANGTLKESDVQVKVARVATALANTLYQRVTGSEYAGDVKASAHLVDEMLYCFMKSQACRLLAAADYGTSGTREEDYPDTPAPLYVGLATSGSVVPMFAGHLLALLTGELINVNSTACNAIVDADFTHYWLRGWNHTGVCVRTTMNFSQALSPAFIENNYNFQSGVYSTWTESVWHPMWARVFVSSGGGGALAAAVTGVLTTASAFAVTYWLKKHSQLIFTSTPAANIVAINNDATGILRSVNC